MCRWMQQQQIIVRIDNDNSLNNVLHRLMSGKGHILNVTQASISRTMARYSITSVRLNSTQLSTMLINLLIITNIILVLSKHSPYMHAAHTLLSENLIQNHDLSVNNTIPFRRRKKSCLFPLTRPTLIFHADPKVFFSSISEKNPN